MANLQVKGVDDEFYERLKFLAAAENRSVSQQVLKILQEYLAKEKALRSVKPPGQVLLDLFGSWKDERSADEIVEDLRRARRSSTRLQEGL
ncbi:MAG TPA: hypothetical protein VLU25_16950 [Acidobacteriota bacterium]|nr:hypothetical protein [Acidobacteriota bacterium]